MGADNWGTCPRCEKKRDEDIVAKRAAVSESYGQVSVEAFDAMREALAAMEAKSPEQRLREDYELGIDEGGGFYVIYKGRCYTDGCDFSHEFRHEEVVS